MTDMKVLIIKTGAAGDVLRSTPLLDHFKNDEVHWLTSPRNVCLAGGNKILTDGTKIDDHYDWVINLEEDPAIFDCVNEIAASRHTGPYTGKDGVVYYQPCPNKWFDMSRISRYGIDKANQLKLNNRFTYQRMLFEMIDVEFNYHPYIKPAYNPSDAVCEGDIGVVVSDDSVWPTKNWAKMEQTVHWLRDMGYAVNMLQRRDTITEHIADICAHKVIICGDSLPMHICIAHKIPCVALFNCTSPWEIESYGVVTKIVSPMLEQHYYQKGYNEVVALSIPEEEVIQAVQKRLQNDRHNKIPMSASS
jgi:heptosyltransferase II